MTHFTNALNEVLERMKSQGQTRQQYAQRIAMPLSTMVGYYSGRNAPNAEALNQLVSGLEEDDAARVIIAHLIDETPKAWRQQIAVSTTAAAPRNALPIDAYAVLPARFLQQIEAILREARGGNENIVGFIDEFVGLVGWDTSADAGQDPCLPNILDRNVEEIPAQRVPAKTVRTKATSGSSTSPQKEDASLISEKPAGYVAKSKPSKKP